MQRTPTSNQRKEALRSKFKKYLSQHLLKAENFQLCQRSHQLIHYLVELLSASQTVEGSSEDS
jgi:hypothetical protein